MQPIDNNLRDHLLEKEIRGKKIKSIERMVNRFGKNQDVFKAVDSSGKSYFLKMGSDDSVKNEILACKYLRKYLPIPKLMDYGVGKSFSYIVYQFLEDCRILSDVWGYDASGSEHSVLFDNLLNLEKNRYSLLKKLYEKKQIVLKAEEVLHCRANKLFLQRLLGNRFMDYFLLPGTLGSYFTKKFVINGNKMDATIGSMLYDINRRLLAGINSRKSVIAVKGTGDAHNNNILVDSNNKIFFTDFEYFGAHSFAMELAKPYYIDFIGNYFFHYPNKLEEFYQIDWSEKGEEIIVTLNVKKYPKKELALTKIKIETLGSLVDGLSADTLSLTDYLLICHVLDRNPNTYSQFNKKLFLVFIFLFHLFDPLDPDSLFDFCSNTHHEKLL